MLSKFAALDNIVHTGAVLIVRLESAEEAFAVSEAAIAGGIRALEITLSVPGALDVISRLNAKYAGEGILIGAGTVLDAQAAFAAVNAGARMLVSPNLNRGMLELANRYQAVSVSGAFTPTEIVDTMAAGADIVKLFPTEIIGPGYVKTILAPLPQAPILPAGGVTTENVKDWFDAGVTAVGVGSAITKAARVDGDYLRVTHAAETFLTAIAKARA